MPFTPLTKGLCLKRNRTEWLLTGQLTTSRPDLGQHINPFLYLKNGPLQGPDPFGLDKEEDDCEESLSTCVSDSQSGGQNCLAQLMSVARAACNDRACVQSFIYQMASCGEIVPRSCTDVQNCSYQQEGRRLTQ